MASFDKSDTLQKITDIVVKELKVEPDTIKIDVSFQDLGILFESPELEELDIAGNDLTEVGILSELKGLRSLNISNNEIASIRALDTLTELESLDLSGNPIEDIEPLWPLWRLQTLIASSTQITDIGVLLRLASLSYVDLRDTPLNVSAGSAAGAVIERLRDRGVKVEL